MQCLSAVRVRVLSAQRLMDWGLVLQLAASCLLKPCPGFRSPGICTEGSPKLHDYLSLAPQCEPLSQAWNVLLHDTHPLAVSCPVP